MKQKYEVHGEAKMKSPYSLLLDMYFLDLAKAAATTVGRVIRYGSAKGNGFLISDKLFLTNNHIIHNSEVAKLSNVEFGYELTQKGQPKRTTKFKFAPNEFLMSSPEEELDFTIVAVGGRISGNAHLTDFGFCPLKKEEDTYELGEFVNIIQHPGNDFKKIALHNNRLVAHSTEVLHYHATVISGSSGSPVFNDRFEPIALHHYGKPSRLAFTQDGKPGPTEINEGIRISAIVKRIESERKKLAKKQRILIETALTYPFSHPSLPNSK